MFVFSSGAAVDALGVLRAQAEGVTELVPCEAVHPGLGDDGLPDLPELDLGQPQQPEVVQLVVDTGDERLGAGAASTPRRSVRARAGCMGGWCAS